MKNLVELAESPSFERAFFKNRKVAFLPGKNGYLNFLALDLKDAARFSSYAIGRILDIRSMSRYEDMVVVEGRCGLVRLSASGLMGWEMDGLPFSHTHISTGYINAHVFIKDRIGFVKRFIDYFPYAVLSTGDEILTETLFNLE